MRAKIFVPNHNQIPREDFMNIIISSNHDVATRYFESGAYVENARIILKDKTRSSETYSSQRVWDKEQEEFLEMCFDHTALSPEWEGKRSISVGDIIKVVGGDIWFCAGIGWAKVA
jgi:hypothetical protein